METSRAEDRVARSQLRLRALGQRITPARTAVLAVLAATQDHLGAQEIADRSSSTDSGIHRATVYRALTTLCDLELVAHTHTSGSGAVYHLTEEPPDVGTAHAHLECTVCHRLIDVPADFLAPVASGLAKDYAFTFEPGHATLLGVCADCDERSSIRNRSGGPSTGSGDSSPVP